MLAHGGLQLESQPFDGKQFISDKPHEFYIVNNVILSNTQSDLICEYQPTLQEEFKTVNLTEETISEDGVIISPVQV